MIIDFHTHTFPSKISGQIVERLSREGHIQYFTDGSLESLAGSMSEAKVNIAINLPVMTRADQVIKVNDSLIKRQEEFEQQGVITFGGLHPDFAEFESEICRLKEHGIKGIKLHPAFQGRDINDAVYKRQIYAVSDAGLICVVHCGIDISFPDHNYASVRQLLEVIRDVQPDKFVLAHMGGWQAWDEVEKYLAGAPVWLDTSYSLGVINCRTGEVDRLPYRTNLDGKHFTKLSRKHGTEKILFATDSPWASQREYVELLNNTELTDLEKEQIFSQNAINLLGK